MRTNQLHVHIQAVQRKTEKSRSTISLKYFVKHVKRYVGASCLSLSSFAFYIDYWLFDHFLLLNHVSYLYINYDCVVLSIHALIDLSFLVQ